MLLTLIVVDGTYLEQLVKKRFDLLVLHICLFAYDRVAGDERLNARFERGLIEQVPVVPLYPWLAV